MTDKVQLIKQELERIEQILDDFNKTNNNTIDNGIVSAKKNICKHIKSFIDSLPEEPVSENLEEVATKWDETASFQPFYMQLDSNGNPCEVKQDITTHKESFKAGAEWQKQKDEELFSKDTWTYIEENYPNITKEEKLRLYDISIKSRLAGAETFKKHMKETLQTEYEKGLFDMREKMMKDAIDATILDVDAQTIEFGLWPEKLPDIKEGDKVKIIIIKKE